MLAVLKVKRFTKPCLAILLISAASAGYTQVSAFADELEAQRTRTQTITNELMEMIRQGENDPAVIERVGNRFLGEIRNSIEVTDKYRNATTRFGLQSEIDNFKLIFYHIQNGEAVVRQLANEDAPVAFTPTEIDRARSGILREIIPDIRQQAEMYLGIQGANDFLNDPGFETAVDILASNVERRVLDDVENEIRKITGARINIGMSLEDHLKNGASRWISSKFSSVIVSFALNHFVVEFLANKIINWIGPRLQEFLRPKGNLDARLDRASSGMRARENTLNSMEGEEHLLTVRRHVEAAEGHIKANNYLRGDIQRANRQDLADKLTEAEESLQATLRRTRMRFMLNQPYAQEEFQIAIDMMERVYESVESMLSRLKAAPPTAEDPTPPADAPEVVFSRFAKVVEADPETGLTKDQRLTVEFIPLGPPFGIHPRTTSRNMTVVIKSLAGSVIWSGNMIIDPNSSPNNIDHRVGQGSANINGQTANKVFMGTSIHDLLEGHNYNATPRTERLGMQIPSDGGLGFDLYDENDQWVKYVLRVSFRKNEIGL